MLAGIETKLSWLRHTHTHTYTHRNLNLTMNPNLNANANNVSAGKADLAAQLWQDRSRLQRSARNRIGNRLPACLFAFRLACHTPSWRPSLPRVDNARLEGGLAVGVTLMGRQAAMQASLAPTRIT